jgi:hypothetical protein
MNWHGVCNHTHINIKTHKKLIIYYIQLKLKQSKNMKKLLALAVVILGFTAVSFAQVSATATASGTIVSPIAIANAGNLNFGNVAVSATAGTVILAPAGTRTITGGVTLPAVPGTVTAAHFAVTGSQNYTYAITLPSTPTTVTSGANTMTVNAFTSTPTTTGTLDGSGAQTVDVGATLNVGAAQASGTYLSATPFTVTVNYN